MDQQEFQSAVLTRLDTLESGRLSDQQVLQLHAQSVQMNFSGLHEQNNGFREERRLLRDDLRTMNIRMNEDTRMLAEIYEARHEITMTWGWQWAAVSVLIAITSVGITQFFTIIILS
jgi:hypothetical protein